MALVIPVTHDIEEKDWEFGDDCYLRLQKDDEGFIREICIKRPNGYHQAKVEFLAENAGSTITLAEMELMRINYGK